ncbi:K(+) antiporter GerN [Seminavis robusta]|uniref:K(+) antiporter GerN n=1 Tax=Seminavis robusta TaxID=568900 RepID=A0A9N8HE65_9STRA|nr:K(+) antiporter GerN [Seminavis robusta]|eukprot:Sro374_g129240.1 K(+) antiporter GerN (877) ;mRNA; f:24754-27822
MLFRNALSRSFIKLVALAALVAAVSCNQVLTPGIRATALAASSVQADEGTLLLFKDERSLAEEADNHSSHAEEHVDEHGQHDAHEGDANSDGHGDGHSELSVHVTYEDIYAILLFLLVATGAGIVFEYLGMPALVGEICTGFLLGPPLADFVPYPEAMVLVGEIGLILLLLEAGVEIDVGQLKQTGTRAISIAGTGSLLPLLVGFGIATAAGESWKGALAVGAAFSPTSLGVASKALGSGGMLNTPVGQLIVASCVIDDIIALIILAMFEVLVAEDPAIWEFFIPIISAVGFLIVLGGAAVFIWPNVIENKILPRFQEQNREMVMFSIMSVLLLLYLPLLNYTRASYLSGAFLAGMSFSQIHSAHDSFIKNTHQLMVWLLRVFFASSIGFQIPITKFSDPAVIGWGFALYACVAMKFPLGLYVPKFDDVEEGASFNPSRRDFFVTGLAMSCRGEFSFIIASFGLSAGLIGEDFYSAVVWAVLISCVTSPFVLLKTIKYYKGKQQEYMDQMNPLLHKESRTADGKMPLHLYVHINSHVQWGMQERFREKLHDLGLQIVEHTTTHQRGVDSMVDTTIYVRDTQTEVDLPTIQKQRKTLRALVQSTRKLINSQRNLDVSNHSKIRNLSSGDLKELAQADQNGMDDESQHTLDALRGEKEIIEAREEEVRLALSELIHQQDAAVTVEEWNPWDWTAALKTLAENHGEGALTRRHFMNLFDKIDADGGGTVDEDELYEALVAAGVKITRANLATMIAMVDDNNDGEVDREEWKSAIDFFLEQQAAERTFSGFMGPAMSSRGFMSSARQLMAQDSSSRRFSSRCLTVPAPVAETSRELDLEETADLEISDDTSGSFAVGMGIDDSENSKDDKEDSFGMEVEC